MTIFAPVFLNTQFAFAKTRKISKISKGDKLKIEAGKLFIAIAEKDIGKIMKMIDPESGLASDGRHMVYYKEVQAELLRQDSHYHRHLFGKEGIRDQLLSLGNEVEIKTIGLYDEDWAGVTFEKVQLSEAPIRKPSSMGPRISVRIVTGNEEYHRPKLTFKWKKGRWYIMTLFE